MTLSQEGVRFIEQHEGNAGTLPANQRLTGDIYGLYNDSAGHYSEGIGHLVHQGRYTTQDIVDYYNRHPSGETQAEA
jgi:GH24 family phage-related lysozyme (muramidase)